MPKVLKHYLISGRVQGVFYRESTRNMAENLGIHKGWVQNLADGTVEAMVYADKEKLNELEKWLWQGPIAAKVDGVKVKTIDALETHQLFFQEMREKDAFVVKR